MNKTKSAAFSARVGIAALGVAILTTVGGAGVAANAAEEDVVDVNVEIEEAAGPGFLAMSVASNATALTEQAPSGTDRVFTGSLPTVTVTDTREDSEITPGAYWYVTGTMSDFVGDAGQPDIVSTDSFGWAPEILTGDPSEVAAGDPVAPGEGFIDFELLASAWDSTAGAPGSWTASADMTLKTPGTVAPGQYAATLTLSLFED